MTIDFDPTETPVRDLRAAAQEVPGQTFFTLNGGSHSYAEVWERALDVAYGLRASGVVPGDRVVIMTPNRPESIYSWFGVQAFGAVDAPVSVEATGAFLRHVIDDLEPAAVIGTPETLATVAASGARDIPLHVVLADTVPEHDQSSKIMTFREMVAAGSERAGGAVLPPDAAALGTVMYSSGTTGPSKGVMLSQGYYSALAQAHIQGFELRPGSRLYCVQPLCHIDARSAVVDGLRLRGEIGLGEHFSVSRFWPEVEAHDADVFFYVGTMIHLLYKRSPRPDPVPSKRRLGMGSATPPTIHRQFEQEFGAELVEGYGMTEFGLVAVQRPGATEIGNVGRAVPWAEVQLVDDDDDPVEAGTAGELLVRPSARHLHMMGYWRNAHATVEAWRGLWFHTGDVLRQLPHGALEYVGRKKDFIRRRGENVSAWEVEEAAARHAAVLQAAAIGVPSPLGDEDVALLVVPSDVDSVDLAELRASMARDLPRFALPRYIEVVKGLPKTPSERVAKGKVRERGITSAAVDFEQ